MLRPPEGFAFESHRLAPLAAETIRERAPDLVSKGETLDFKTLRPEPGGLFDFKVFGPGTVIDAPAIDATAAYKPRKTRFARITLAEPIVHPLALAHAPDELAARAGWPRVVLDRWRAAEVPEERGALIAALVTSGHDRGLVVTELAVLPPELRPLNRLDDDRWQSSALNDHYKRIVSMNARWKKLIDQAAPAAQIATEQRHVVSAILALYENEDRAHPVVDATQQPLGSMRSTLGGTGELFAAIGELDRHGPITGRAFRANAALFAFGFELQAVS